MALSKYAKQQILRQQTQARFPYLIKIMYYTNGSDTPQIFRFVNADNNVTFNNEVYEASCFSIEPPQQKNDGFTDAKISISAIDQEWIAKIRETQKRAKVLFMATIQYEQNGSTKIEAINEMEFTLTNATWNDTAIQWTMKFDDLLDVIVPMETITTSICPALA